MSDAASGEEGRRGCSGQRGREADCDDCENIEQSLPACVMVQVVKKEEEVAQGNAEGKLMAMTVRRYRRAWRNV